MPIAESLIQLVILICQIHLETLKAMPEEERAAYGKMVVEDLKFWRRLFNIPTP